jgi:hypothetical protein
MTLEHRFEAAEYPYELDGFQVMDLVIAQRCVNCGDVYMFEWNDHFPLELKMPRVVKPISEGQYRVCGHKVFTLMSSILAINSATTDNLNVAPFCNGCIAACEAEVWRYDEYTFLLSRAEFVAETRRLSSTLEILPQPIFEEIWSYISHEALDTAIKLLP